MLLLRLLYPFSWAHTYIPVVPESLLGTVCCPTPSAVGVQMRFRQEAGHSPMEEVAMQQEGGLTGATGRPGFGSHLCC